MKRKYWCGRI